MNPVVWSSRSEEWATPQWLYELLDSEFHFTLDPASTDENAKCAKHYTKEQDGLSRSWGGETVFCNPPFGRGVGKWVAKAQETAANGDTVVMLLPARTDTQWFHDYIYGIAEVRFIKGRLKYGGAKHNSPFPSMIIIFKGRGRDHEGEHGSDQAQWGRS